MKRLCLLAVSLLLLVFTACDLKPSKKPITENFLCNFTATYDQMKLVGELERGMAGSLTMTLTKPTSLAGLVCFLQEGELTLKLGKLEYKTPVIPEAAVPRFVQEVLDALVSASRDTVDGESVVYTGNVGTQSFVVTTDADSGFIQTISLSDAKLDIQFKDVLKIKEEK